jgi:hypothetical protein
MPIVKRCQEMGRPRTLAERRLCLPESEDILSILASTAPEEAVSGARRRRDPTNPILDLRRNNIVMGT